MNRMKVNGKRQQQTLSIRVSAPLREYIERSAQLISSHRGESLSLSDVARILLESAITDRSDSRFEVADLQGDPTGSLWDIRKKWEKRQALSRAEWILLAYYVQLACEGLSENPAMPRASTFVVLLESLLRIRDLRAGPSAGLDRYYLGNLGAPDAALNDRQLDSDIVPQVIERLVHELRECPHPGLPIFGGRNLYVALRDEVIPDVMALNRVLEPHLDTIFRLAARGHWMRERRPVRLHSSGSMLTSRSSTMSVGGLHLQTSISDDDELRLALFMERINAIYPLDTYPEIQEFTALLERLEGDRSWYGGYFRASVVAETADGCASFQFCRHNDGITFRFTVEEWKNLRTLFSATLGKPGLQAVLHELSLAYG
jgi:hypothetical protein